MRVENRCLDDVRIINDNEPLPQHAPPDDVVTDAGACIHQLFDAQAQRTPDRVAVTFEGDDLSYRQLCERANRLAHYLKRRGVRPDVLVGIYMERSTEMLVCMLAVLKAGGAYVPLDPALPSERLTFIMEETRMSLVLTSGGLRGGLRPQSAFVVSTTQSSAEIAAESAECPRGEAEAENLAYVIYTSGSTGRPKGVMISHRAVCNYITWMQESFTLAESDSLLQKAPFTFDASVLEFYLPLLAGARLVIARQEGVSDSDYLIKLISRESITVAQFVPSLLRLFLEAPGIESCRSLRLVFSGGEALKATTQERFFERLPWVRLYNLYGPTETTVYSTCWPCVEQSGQPLVPIGKPIKGTRVCLLDDDLHPIVEGDTGELYIGGEGLSTGYLNRPDLTAEKFIPDPFGSVPGARLYRTGDLARLRHDGSLEFFGRADFQVKVHGVRIELDEIEHALNQHPSVRESVVAARETAAGEKQLVAYLVAARETLPAFREFRLHLKERLPEYMIPSAYVALDSLPLTFNGKVDRGNLPAPSGGRPEMAQAFVAPRSPLESELKLIWEEILDVRPVGVADDFFELGGDSLQAAHMLVRVHAKFGKVLPPSVLIPAANIERLAGIISSPDGAQRSSLVAIRTKGSRLPLFFVHGLGGEVLGYRALARHLGDDRPFYGLRAHGFDGSQPHLTTIEAMAAAYVQEVLTVQAEGPFHLGGYSSGGVIAFEMAQQLWALDQEVAFLAVLDEEAPNSWNQKVLSLKFAAGLLSDLPLWFIDYVWKRPGREVIADVKRHVRRIAGSGAGKILHGGSDDSIRATVAGEVDVSGLSEAHIRLMEIQYQALLSYRPRPYPGRVTLYRTRSEALLRSHTFDKGWGKLAGLGIDVRVVPGNHQNLYEEPHVRALAEKLRLDLDGCG